METISVCPVCGLKISPANPSLPCPFCQAEKRDRVPLLLTVEAPSHSGRINALLAIVCALIVVVIVVLIISLWHSVRLNSLESRVLDQKTAIEQHISTLGTRLEQLAENQMFMLQDTMSLAEVVFTKRIEQKKGQAMKEKRTLPVPKNNTLKSPSAYTKFWIYDADDHDTLWGLAERFYGSGKYYPVLLEHNPQLGIFDVGGGDRVNVLRQKELVPQIYDTIVEKKDSALFWFYTVQKDDTLTSIAQKFYGSALSAHRVVKLNAEIPIRPGVRLKIQLK